MAHQNVCQNFKAAFASACNKFMPILKPSVYVFFYNEYPLKALNRGIMFSLKYLKSQKET